MEGLKMSKEDIREMADFWKNKAELAEIEGDMIETKCCNENAEYYYKLARSSK